MTTLYLDTFSGISGDMFLGAMLDLGVGFADLQRDLTKLGLHGYHLHAVRKTKSGISGIAFQVHLEHDHAHGHAHSHGHQHFHHHPHQHPHDSHSDHSHDESRNFSQIQGVIRASSLSDWVKEKSLSVFRRVAVAEGKIHGHPPEEVHFHEVGALDSIVDIVGACIALELLGKPRVLASAPVEGQGWVKCAHGMLPIPAPATLEILSARAVSLTQCEEPHELITPTGAALLAEFVESFGPMRGLAPKKIGYGLGTRDNRTRPNVLRACLCAPASTASDTHDWETDTIAVLETNLDDISSEVLGHFVETALAAGALDVFDTPIQMKKNRPGVLLTVLCASEDADRFSSLILRETTTFGVRRTFAERRKLRREFIQVSTPHGEVKVKLGKLDGQIIQASPEYESCRQVAGKAGVPLKEAMQAAAAAARQR